MVACAPSGFAGTLARVNRDWSDWSTCDLLCLHRVRLYATGDFAISEGVVWMGGSRTVDVDGLVGAGSHHGLSPRTLLFGIFGRLSGLKGSLFVDVLDRG